MQKNNSEEDFNFNHICEFSKFGCKETDFTAEGLKKHNEEYISKHLFLIKNKLELNETKNEKEISKIKNNQVKMSQILCKLSQKLESNENKTNELLLKFDEALNKIEKFEEKDKILLRNKSKRSQKTFRDLEFYGICNYNKKPKIEKNYLTIFSDEKYSSNNNNEYLSTTKIYENEKIIKREKNRIEREIEAEKNNKKIHGKSKFKKTNKDKKNEKFKQKEIMIPSKFLMERNKIEIIDEDSDSVKNVSKEKNSIISNTKNISSNLDKEKSLIIPSVNLSFCNDYKFCLDLRVLNNKKVRWEIFLKKLSGYVALGISGKKSDEQTSVILDDYNNEKINEEIIPMINSNDLLLSSNIYYLLTNEHDIIIWKNGSNYKKSNNDLPILKEGDNLIIIYCPKFAQLKIQKGDYIFIFENVGNKVRQLLHPCVIFGNKDDKAVFHNFQVLAEYKK